jgi:hypothetical protein
LFVNINNDFIVINRLICWISEIYKSILVYRSLTQKPKLFGHCGQKLANEIEIFIQKGIKKESRYKRLSKIN